MKIISYFLFSAVIMTSFILYAVYTKEQFYPTILYLVNSKMSFVLALNFALCFTLMIGNLFVYLFLGKLRDAEIELLVDKLKYHAMETSIALTIFRNELSITVFAQFLLLLFIKSFHWLSKCRLEYLEQILPIPWHAHLRQQTLMGFFLFTDLVLAYYCLDHTIHKGKSVLILFGFEFGLLVLAILNVISRYIIQVLDNNLTNGLQSKGLYIMVLDVVTDALAFVTYVCFFCLVFSFYGLPLHIIRETWIAFIVFHKRLTSLMKYLRLMHNIERRFPDATREELDAAGDCLVCREGFGTDGKGKKLPCSHIFHLDCLRMWLQHQQACPLCRADISLGAMDTEGATGVPQEEGATGDRVAGDGGEGEGEQVPGPVPAGNIPDNQADPLGDQAAPTISPSVTVASTESPTTASRGEDSGFQFPAFYQCITDIPLCAAPLLTAQNKKRVIKQGTVVFVNRRMLYKDSSLWLEASDGFIPEAIHANGQLLYFARPYTKAVNTHAPTINKEDVIPRHLREITAMLPKVVSSGHYKKKEVKQSVSTPMESDAQTTKIMGQNYSEPTVADLAEKLEIISGTLHTLQEQLQISQQIIKTLASKNEKALADNATNQN